ncbi:unnamed protein product [Strongylus vulgaris]|uniref:Uncharacterized protein n=1 Tax=Strongylus vulgaris TaxID=40348 RepID=A0A3P7J1I3_STRVU|nr:unnamed protein product [Strongylus vulgaris]
MVARNIRAIRSVLNPGTIRFTISDMDATDQIRLINNAQRIDGILVSAMCFSEVYESDPIRLRGEAALVLLETLSGEHITYFDNCSPDSIETDPEETNLCFLLFGFNSGAHLSGQLFDIDAPPTGFHQVLSILEQFIAAPDPFQLQFSALIEPVFRLLVCFKVSNYKL